MPLKENKLQKMLDEKERKRKRLLKAAMASFRENGYTNTSVDSITRTAGVAKGTFYSFFESKVDVLYYYYQKELEKSAEEFEQKSDPNDGFIDRIGLLIAILINNVYKNKDLGRIVWFNVRIPAFGTRDKVEAGVIDLFAGIVETAKRNNEIREDVETEILIESIFALCNLYLTYWLNGALKTKKQYFTRIREALKLNYEGYKREMK